MACLPRLDKKNMKEPLVQGWYWYRCSEEYDPASSGEWGIVYADGDGSIEIADTSVFEESLHGQFVGPLVSPWLVEEDNMIKMQIFATDRYGKRREITDLYWFEEEGVHSFEDGGNGDYRYDFLIDGIPLTELQRLARLYTE